MSEESNLIIETANRIFTDHCSKDVIDAAEAGLWPQQLWQTLAESGLTLAGISEAAGGSGGDVIDALEIMRKSGFYAVPLPLAETFIAALLIEMAGGEVPQGRLTVASGQFSFNPSKDKAEDKAEGKEGTQRLVGEASAVAYVDWCDHILCVHGDNMALVTLQDVVVDPGVSMAGEPRSALSVDTEVPPHKVWKLKDCHNCLLETGALVRSYQMAGALEALLQMSVQYALDRQQFGRPISRFQAIQHQLAVMAGEIAAASKAASLAGEFPDLFHLATAKSRVGEATGIAVEIAHQVHGAMGYTREHELNSRTRRLWTWREDFDNETQWNLKLGEAICQQGGEGLWELICTQ